MQSTVTKVILWTAIIIAIAAFEAGDVNIAGWTMTIPLGIAVVFHSVLTYAYERKFYFLLHPDRDFRGVWIYQLTNQRTNRVLFGKFIVKQSLDQVEINNAKVWYGDKPITAVSHRGSWTGVNASILQDERELFIRFKMTANVEETNPERKAGQAYYGTMTLHYSAGQKAPLEMNGSFRDNKPNTEDFGHVLCVRVRQNPALQPIVRLFENVFSRVENLNDDTSLTAM